MTSTPVVSKSNIFNDFNLSWLDEHKRLTDMQQNYMRENMQHIKIHSIYINTKSFIDKIDSNDQDLVTVGSTHSVLYNEKVLQLVQNNRNSIPGKKYKLLDILVYNIDIEPEHVQNFVQNSTGYPSSFLKKIPIIDDITIPASIFIFHDLNAIYFVFEEIESDEYTLKPKPIIKIHAEGNRSSRRVSVPNEVGYNCLRESKVADLESVTRVKDSGNTSTSYGLGQNGSVLGSGSGSGSGSISKHKTTKKVSIHIPKSKSKYTKKNIDMN
jgi:hypothetical protein